MCCQRSVYCPVPYSEGFEYAVKMRDKQTEDHFDPYEDDEFMSRSFNDGYRDGIFTVMFHQMEN